MHELLLESIKRTWYTCQSTWPRRTNQEPRSWANGFFKIEGFGGKRFLHSPPPPPSFHLFVLAPFFARPEFEKLIRVRTARISVASYGKPCYAGYVREGGWKKKKQSRKGEMKKKNSCRANCTLHVAYKLYFSIKFSTVDAQQLQKVWLSYSSWKIVIFP